MARAGEKGRRGHPLEGQGADRGAPLCHWLSYGERGAAPHSASVFWEQPPPIHLSNCQGVDLVLGDSGWPQVTLADGTRAINLPGPVLTLQLNEAWLGGPGLLARGQASAWLGGADGDMWLC